MERESITMFCADGMPQKLDSLRVYRSAYHLLTEEATWEAMPDAFCDYLQGRSGAEMLGACFYVCINESTVLLVDIISGEVYWSMNIWNVLEKELELFELEKEGENHV